MPLYEHIKTNYNEQSFNVHYIYMYVRFMFIFIYLYLVLEIFLLSSNLFTSNLRALSNIHIIAILDINVEFCFLLLFYNVESTISTITT